MGRILFWVLLGLLVYVAWRWWSAKQRLHDSTSEEARKKVTDETMVPCDVCGLNIPQSEAFAGNGRWYCSDEHRKRGPS
jgi:uncharacterized protein